MSRRFVEIAFCEGLEKAAFTIEDISDRTALDSMIERQCKRIFESIPARTDRYTGRLREYDEIQRMTMMGKTSEFWMYERYNGKLQFLEERAEDASLYNDLLVVEGQMAGQVVEVKTVAFPDSLTRVSRDSAYYDASISRFVFDGNEYVWSDFDHLEQSGIGEKSVRNRATLKSMGLLKAKQLKDKISSSIDRVSKNGFYRANMVSLFVCNDYHDPRKWWYLNTLVLP